MWAGMFSMNNMSCLLFRPNQLGLYLSKYFHCSKRHGRHDAIRTKYHRPRGLKPCRLTHITRTEALGTTGFPSVGLRHLVGLGAASLVAS